MASFAIDIEVVPYAIVEITPTYVQAPLTSETIQVTDVEVVPFTIVGLVPTYFQAAMSAETIFAIDVEVILGGATIISSSEEDVVAQFVMALIPTSRTTMYTVPTGRVAVIRWMDLVNTTGSALTVDVWLNNIQWENDRSVAGNDKYARDTITTLGPGQLIEMQASGSGCNGFIAGVLELAS
jgi:hypothetical protein